MSYIQQYNAKQDDEFMQKYMSLPKPIKEESKPEPQMPNKEIDWEQRRYEIAKQMLASIYLDEGQEARSGRHTVEFEYQDYEGSAREAVSFADALIAELKKEKR